MGIETAGPAWDAMENTRKGLDWLASVFDLGVRLWIAQAFFKSGLIKISDWESTLFLFKAVYSVPILPPGLAAWLAACAELALPVLLVIGLATRLSALGLFALNYVAVLSFPDLGLIGIKDHVLWGLMLATIFFHGPGRASVDEWLRRRYSRAG